MGTRVLHGSPLHQALDHPHAYGDKLLRLKHSLIELGSSPRVWGQVKITKKTGKNLRIIPTRMGTRNPDYPTHNGIEDHPHAYGDKLRVKGSMEQAIGSSPRVWGQVGIPLFFYPFTGIIPTRMGTSCRKSDINKLSKDHPHAYGDKQLRTFYAPKSLGSSPRVWGQAIIPS